MDESRANELVHCFAQALARGLAHLVDRLLHIRLQVDGGSHGDIMHHDAYKNASRCKHLLWGVRAFQGSASQQNTFAGTGDGT
jgi:hypothetical protein